MEKCYMFLACYVLFHGGGMDVLHSLSHVILFSAITFFLFFSRGKELLIKGLDFFLS